MYTKRTDSTSQREPTRCRSHTSTASSPVDAAEQAQVIELRDLLGNCNTAFFALHP